MVINVPVIKKVTNEVFDGILERNKFTFAYQDGEFVIHFKEYPAELTIEIKVENYGPRIFWVSGEFSGVLLKYILLIEEELKKIWKGGTTDAK